MTKPLPYLTIILFSFLFFHGITLGQSLSELQQNAVNTYIETSGALSKYDKAVRQAVLNDPQTLALLQNCMTQIKQYAAIETCSKSDNLYIIYTTLGQNVADLRDKFLPDFNINDYTDVSHLFNDNLKAMSTSKYAGLLDQYYQNRRKDKLNAENAFTSLIFQAPESLETARKEVSAILRREASDVDMSSWLGMNYYQRYRLEAAKKFTEEANTRRKLLDEGCLSSLPKKFEEASDKTHDTPQNWSGIFANDVLSLKFDRTGGSVVATSDVQQGTVSESSRWKLDVIGSSGEGKWTVILTGEEYAITRAGTMTVTLDGDVMSFEMSCTDWSIKWKPEVKPYEIGETAATVKGTKMTGTLKRK